MNKSKIVSWIKNNRDTFLFSIIVFIIFVVLFYFFPYSCDDWAWGSSIGLERLLSLFDNYNGRYAGNILVIILTRSKIIDVFFTALCFSAFCVLPKILTDSKFFITLPFSLLMLIFMPRDLRNQTVVWTSGFSNYVPPILLIVIYLCIVKKTFESEHHPYNKITTLFAGIIGFGASLFMENVTIYGLAISAFIIIFSYIKFKKTFTVQIANFLGCVFGTVFMFTNSAYTSILKGTDYYRSTALDDGFFSTISTHIKDILKYFFTDNSIMMLIVTFLCFTVTLVYVKNIDNKVKKLFSIINCFLNCVSFLMVALKNQIERIPKASIGEYTDVFFAVIYSVTTFFTVVVCIQNQNKKRTSLLALISIPILIAPLLIVNPISARCFFPPYFTCVILCVSLIDYILSCISFRTKAKSLLCIGLIFANIAGLVFLFNIYIPIHKYYVKREEYLDKQIELCYKTITLCRLPNSDYVISPDPDIGFWDSRYKLLNKIDSDATFEFMSPDEFDVWAEEFDKGVTQP